jgi:hypothetical protein
VPPTVVHAALGVILAAAVLGPAFDRRTAVVAALAGAAPDLDAVIGLLAVPGGLPVPESTHGAVLHSVFLPGLAAFAVYVDARRDRRLRGRYGSAGVRLAWVAVLVYAVVGIGLDLFNIAAANPLWPLHDMFYGIIGQIQFTNQELFVQTYVRFDVDGHAVYVGQQGDTGSRFLRSPFNPTRGPDGDAERTFAVVDSGWQLLVLASAPAVGWAAARSGVPAAVTAGDAADGTDADASAPATEEGPAPTDD